MKRKPRKRAASKRAKTTKKGTKARRSALKRKPTRAAKATRTKSAGRARAKTTKAKQPAVRRGSSAARTNGAASRRAPKPEQEPVLEHAVIVQEEETSLNVGGYDENEDFEETYTEEEEELPEESEEDY